MAATAVALIGCSSDASPAAVTTAAPVTTIAPMTFEPDGGCGDAEFFALGRNGTSRLFVAIDQHSRSTTEPTELDIELPDDAISVGLDRGVNLGQLVCNDAPMDARIDSTTHAVTGSVTIRLAPRGLGASGCGVHGEVELHDVVMDDGTPIADLRIGSEGIGCYVG